MAESLGSAVLDLSADAAPLKRTVAGARVHTLREMATTAKKSRALMTGAFLAVGVVAAAGLKRVGDEWREVENIIRVGTGATGKDLEKLKGNFKEVFREVPNDAKETATAIADVNTRLGLTGRPLERSSKQFLTLARITGSEVAPNIEAAQQAFKDWEVETKNQEKTLDGFFRVSQATGASIPELMSNVQKFGSPLRQIGFELDEAASMFAQFTAAGVNMETLMPGFKFAIANVHNETGDLGKQLRKVGIDIKEGPEVAVREFTELIANAEDPAKHTGLAMQLFGQRAGADMVEAMSQGRFELDDMMETFNEGSDTIEAAGEDALTLGDRLDILKNRGMVALEKPALAVVTGLEAMASAAITVTDAIDDIPGPVKTAIGAAAGMAAGIVVLAASFRKARGAVTALYAAARAHPWILIASVVAAVATVIIKNWDKVKAFLGNVWGWIKGAAGTLANVVSKAARMGFLGPVPFIIARWGDVKRALRSVWDWIKGAATDTADWVSGAFGDMLDFVRGLPGKFGRAGKAVAKALGNGIIGLVEKGLNFALKGPFKFLNKVFDVLAKAPFIGRDDFPELDEDSPISIPRLARGGVVNAPMAIVGEEAPRHPEFVIPTNPAYRPRAQGLLADAAQRLGMPGFALGGQFVSTAYGPPWGGINGMGVTATGVDLRPAKEILGVAVDPNVIPLGSKLQIKPNPFGTEDRFSAFDTGGAIKGNRIDFYDWRGRDSQMAWGTRNVEVGRVVEGTAGTSGGGLSGTLDFFNPMNLIKKLPKPSDFLPDWLLGMGKFVISKAKDWLLDQATGLVSAGTVSPSGKVTGTNALANQLAAKFGLSITSGYRDPAHNAAVGGVPGSSHTKGSPLNPGAHDFVPPSSAALRYAMEKLGAKWADIHDFGSGLHLHVSWFRKGGIIGDAMESAVVRGLNLAPAGMRMPEMPLPYLGQFHNGGIAPREGLAHVLGGEAMGFPGVWNLEVNVIEDDSGGYEVEALLNDSLVAFNRDVGRQRSRAGDRSGFAGRTR